MVKKKMCVECYNPLCYMRQTPSVTLKVPFPVQLMSLSKEPTYFSSFRKNIINEHNVYIGET